jgi:hypothetical protein
MCGFSFAPTETPKETKEIYCIKPHEAKDSIDFLGDFLVGDFLAE